MRAEPAGSLPLHRMTELAQELIAPRLFPGDSVLDGTMGNGFDTLFLWKQVQPGGRVTAFDLQAKAVETTDLRLRQAGWDGSKDSVHLIRDSHRHLNRYLHHPLRGAMFNLGYLPGSDRRIVTAWPDLREALNQLTETWLLPGGVISIISYSGHPGALSEQQSLLTYLSHLPSKTWSVLEICRKNTDKPAPMLLMIQNESIATTATRCGNGIYPV